mgnify:FL=1
MKGSKPLKLIFLKPVLIGFSALIFPGLGHLLLKKWLRSAVLAFAILLLFLFGLKMEGKLYMLGSGQLIEIVLFIADFCNGIPYFLAKYWGFGEGNLENQSFEYGTTYLAVAGLLNLLVAINAYDIAVGRKH